MQRIGNKGAVHRFKKFYIRTQRKIEEIEVKSGDELKARTLGRLREPLIHRDSHAIFQRN